MLLTYAPVYRGRGGKPTYSEINLDSVFSSIQGKSLCAYYESTLLRLLGFYAIIKRINYGIMAISHPSPEQNFRLD